MACFGLMQFYYQIIKIERLYIIDVAGRYVMHDAFLAASHREQLPVQCDIPVPVQAKVAKRGVESDTMSIPFRIG